MPYSPYLYVHEHSLFWLTCEGDRTRNRSMPVPAGWINKNSYLTYFSRLCIKNINFLKVVLSLLPKKDPHFPQILQYYTMTLLRLKITVRDAGY